MKVEKGNFVLNKKVFVRNVVKFDLKQDDDEEKKLEILNEIRRKGQMILIKLENRRNEVK